jgi:hypothetical protein
MARTDDPRAALSERVSSCSSLDGAQDERDVGIGGKMA